MEIDNLICSIGAICVRDLFFMYAKHKNLKETLSIGTCLLEGLATIDQLPQSPRLIQHASIRNVISSWRHLQANPIEFSQP